MTKTLKKDSSCRGKNVSICEKHRDCKIAYGSKRQYCRKKRNTTKKNVIKQNNTIPKTPPLINFKKSIPKFFKYEWLTDDYEGYSIEKRVIDKLNKFLNNFTDNSIRELCGSKKQDNTTLSVDDIKSWMDVVFGDYYVNDVTGKDDMSLSDSDINHLRSDVWVIGHGWSRKDGWNKSSIVSLNEVKKQMKYYCDDNLFTHSKNNNSSLYFAWVLDYIIFTILRAACEESKARGAKIINSIDIQKAFENNKELMLFLRREDKNKPSVLGF